MKTLIEIIASLFANDKKEVKPTRVVRTTPIPKMYWKETNTNIQWY